eukprot:Nitzschia sp. Nitz4//scaffold121_size67750//60637//61440//NITZ4_006076-RA/size67750-augustus-gene-0.125-mRNA-1//1//CDS//3329534375//8364//frame0
MAVGISQGTEDERPPAERSNSIHLDLVSIRNYVGAFVSQLGSKVSLDTVRPLNMFLGISGHNLCFSPEAFAPPVKKLDKTSVEKFQSRLKLNFSFFLSNYALVAFGVSLVIALLHPGMLLSLGFLWAMWSFHNFLISNEVIVFGTNVGTILSITHRSALLTAVTFLIVVWMCLVPTIMATAISGVIIFTHAILRDPKHIDTKDAASFDDDDVISGSDAEGLLSQRPMVRNDVA